MQATSKHISLFAALGIALLALFMADLCFGAVSIPLKDVFLTLTGNEPAKNSWQYIILDYRLPKAITALLAGIGLSIGGLLMQTLFRNPLAGPDVLGLSSGASLGVAFVILGSALLPAGLSGFFTSAYGVVIAATAGCFIVLLAVLAVARRLRDTMAILIIGLMFSSFTGAIVGILSYFSSAEKLQKYTFWALGSLGNLPWDNIITLGLVLAIGLGLAIYSIKPLDTLLLGERYATSLGININRTRIIIILATSLLTGCVTAFAGPIAFVGLVVPHMAKLLFKTGSHKVLFAGTLLIGAALMLLCDTITQQPGSAFVLPINAITSIVGAPVVVGLLLSKKKGIFS
jgi:iron complex transport system permease protein